MVYLFSVQEKIARTVSKFNLSVIAKSKEETQRLGEEVGKKIKKGGVIALYGDLGNGKTTFVQGLAKGLGIKKRIISPTFIIARSYKIKNQKLKFLYHIDLYRIKDVNDIEGLGLDEIIRNKHNIIVIEWAEKMKELLPDKRWDIKFEFLNEDKRKITINKNFKFEI